MVKQSYNGTDMRHPTILGFIVLFFTIMPVVEVAELVLPDNKHLNRKAQLGKKLFFDIKLSTPPGQSCASCHDAGSFFTDPDQDRPTSEGVLFELKGNCYFKTLRGVVDFYNSRDVKPKCQNPFTPEAEALNKGCWPEPEVLENVNHDELGDLGLSEEEMDDLVAFLLTLTDG